VVGAREASRERRCENADEAEERIRHQGPEHPCTADLEVLPRQDVVGAQVARSCVVEVRRVELRVAPVGEICATLERVLLDRSRA
jgi:hypothetical protein